VFEGSGERPWREDDDTRPLSAYGASKLAGESNARGAGGATLVVRTSWVYAAAGRNFLRTIARAARERAELRVVSDQIGAPTSATLIADAVARMLSDGTESLRARCAEAGGLVHLAAAGETSWHGFACAIVEGLRARGLPLMVERVTPITTDQYPSKARRPHNSRLDLTRLQSAFGIKPRHWREALASELDVVAAEFRAAPGRG
jgi:dTDP-4-dehydrorhamnose reductase